MPVRSPRWFILASLLLAAPDTPGIIELWDDDELVYVGEAPESIRKRLVADLLEHNDWQETTHFGWEISFEPALRGPGAAESAVARFRGGGVLPVVLAAGQGGEPPHRRRQDAARLPRARVGQGLAEGRQGLRR